MNPYQTPGSKPKDDESTRPPKLRGGGKGRWRQYFSLTGSYSRIELLQAAVGLMVLAILLGTCRQRFPVVFPDAVYSLAMLVLYAAWGVALGKRSRDLGTTFTYGMLLGMFIPIIGLLFLFQEGAKYKESRRKSQS